jgi:[ribosomal protein S5]-alanine N-acetyltransferase
VAGPDRIVIGECRVAVPLELTTRRMTVVASTLAMLEAELDSAERLGSLLGAAVPAGWPPGEYDRGAIAFFRERLIEAPAAIGWLGWHALLRAEGGRRATLVGAGGYFGPPDSDGVVEIGYSIVPEFERRGLATELVQALVAHARSFPAVRAVIAHTTPANVGSVIVLERNGFVAAGLGREPGMARFERRLRD